MIFTLRLKNNVLLQLPFRDNQAMKSRYRLYYNHLNQNAPNVCTMVGWAEVDWVEFMNSVKFGANYERISAIACLLDHENVDFAKA